MLRHTDVVYLPDHFTQTDPAAAVELIRTARVADLITSSPDGLTASFVPLLFDGFAAAAGSLVGHLARANAQWRTAGPDCSALAIFRGPDAYVTPRWYPSRSVHGRVVPTWNYVAVHVHGTLFAHDDADWTRSVITRLTTEMEAAADQPWTVDDAPADFIERALEGVVGIELRIDRIEAKWKLSQNQTPADASGVVHGLRSSGDCVAIELAEMIEAANRRRR